VVRLGHLPEGRKHQEMQLRESAGGTCPGPDAGEDSGNGYRHRPSRAENMADRSSCWITRFSGLCERGNGANFTGYMGSIM